MYASSTVHPLRARVLARVRDLAGDGLLVVGDVLLGGLARVDGGDHSSSSFVHVRYECSVGAEFRSSWSATH